MCAISFRSISWLYMALLSDSSSEANIQSGAVMTFPVWAEAGGILDTEQDLWGGAVWQHLAYLVTAVWPPHGHIRTIHLLLFATSDPTSDPTLVQLLRSFVPSSSSPKASWYFSVLGGFVLSQTYHSHRSVQSISHLDRQQVDSTQAPHVGAARLVWRSQFCQRCHHAEDPERKVWGSGAQLIRWGAPAVCCWLFGSLRWKHHWNML